jgi:GNAT superfamily N-acetyltransferase
MKTRITPSSLGCEVCSVLAPAERCPMRCERNFVLSSWSGSLKHSREAGMITADDWVSVMHRQIAKICARPECRVLIAHGEGPVGSGVFLGFIAGEPDERIVYYCFVKELYRRHGIARQLFAELGVDPRGRFAYPCSTRILTDPETNLRTKIPLAIRDPSVARYPKNQRHRSHAA